jgi:hypothetical protein
MPKVGVKMPIKIREDGSMRRTVFPKRKAVDVMVVKPTERPINKAVKQCNERTCRPSESKNHAARYIKVFFSFLISLQCSMLPSFFQARATSLQKLHSSDLRAPPGDPSPQTPSIPLVPSMPSESSLDGQIVPGNQMAAGIVNSIHHRPLGPIANLRENVEPCKRVTGISAMISKMMLAPYPKAIP